MVPAGDVSDGEWAYLVVDLDVSALSDASSLLASSNMRIEGLESAHPTLRFGRRDGEPLAFEGAFEERLGTGLLFLDRVGSAACGDARSSDGAASAPAPAAAGRALAGQRIAFAPGARPPPPGGLKRGLASCLGVEFAGRTTKRLRCALVATSAAAAAASAALERELAL